MMWHEIAEWDFHLEKKIMTRIKTNSYSSRIKNHLSLGISSKMYSDKTGLKQRLVNESGGRESGVRLVYRRKVG